MKFFKKVSFPVLTNFIFHLKVCMCKDHLVPLMFFFFFLWNTCSLSHSIKHSQHLNHTGVVGWPLSHIVSVEIASMANALWSKVCWTSSKTWRAKNVPHKGDSTWLVMNISLTEQTGSISDRFSHNTVSLLKSQNCINTVQEVQKVIF